MTIARRCLTAFMVVGAVWTVVVSGSLDIRRSESFGLPDRIDGPAWRTSSTAADPAGRAVIMMNGSAFPYVGFGDTNAAALIGPGGYRMTERLPYDEWRAGETMLLSPDGRHLVRPDGMTWELGAGILVQDLRTGTERKVDQPASDGGDHDPPGWHVLAWMPDSSGLVVTRSSELPPSGSPASLGRREDLGLVQLDAGSYLRVATVSADPGPALIVAVSPDGQRLAYVTADVLRVIELDDGREVARIPAPRGSVLAGKAAWTPDGAGVVVMTPEPAHAALPDRWKPHVLDTSGRGLASDASFPAVADATAVRAVGWNPSGDLVVVAYRPEPFSEPLSSAQRLSDENVRRADLVQLSDGDQEPRTLLRPPGQTLAIDVAQDAVASGTTFRNPDPPVVRLSLPTVSTLMAVAGFTVLVRRLRRSLAQDFLG